MVAHEFRRAERSGVARGRRRPATRDEVVRILDVPTADPADSLTVSYDVPGRSVRLVWRRDGVVRVDLFRESATRLTVSVAGDTTAVSVAFDSGSLAGRVRVEVYPEIVVRDEMLFH